MKVLGISAYYHDSAAAARQRRRNRRGSAGERFTRKKHDPVSRRTRWTTASRKAATTLDDVDYIAFYDKPLLKFERLLETYLAFAPRGFKSFSMSIPVWLREKLFLKDLLTKELKDPAHPQGRRGTHAVLGAPS